MAPKKTIVCCGTHQGSGVFFWVSCSCGRQRRHGGAGVHLPYWLRMRGTLDLYPGVWLTFIKRHAPSPASLCALALACPAASMPAPGAWDALASSASCWTVCMPAIKCVVRVQHCASAAPGQPFPRAPVASIWPEAARRPRSCCLQLVMLLSGQGVARPAQPQNSDLGRWSMRALRRRLPPPSAQSKP
jgi:hypothetical protein